MDQCWNLLRLFIGIGNSSDLGNVYIYIYIYTFFYFTFNMTAENEYKGILYRTFHNIF